MLLPRHIAIILFWLFVSVVYVLAQGWEPYPLWFTHNSDYLLQQVFALEHPEQFARDVVYYDPKYVTWNPQGLIYLTRVAYRLVGDPFIALKYVSMGICFFFGLGFYALFKRVTQSDYWAIALSLSLVVFYDYYWGNGFGVSYMTNIWARALFRAELGWLICWFLIIAQNSRTLPLFGLVLGFSAAFIHPKPTLGWAITFFMSLAYIHLKGHGWRVKEYCSSKDFIRLIIAGTFFSIFLIGWLAVSLKFFTTVNISEEITTAVNLDRALRSWYIWEILPKMYYAMLDSHTYLATIAFLLWAIWGQIKLGAQSASHGEQSDIGTIRITFCFFLFAVFGVPAIEYIFTSTFNTPAQLSALSVNFASIRMWLLLLGCAGIANWVAESTTPKARNWKIALLTVCLVLASANVDIARGKTWFANSYLQIGYKLVEKFDLNDFIKKNFNRDPSIYLAKQKFFHEALDAANSTPEGSLFYCHMGKNYVRSGAMRPMIFSFDDKQKCFVSKETRPKYYELLQLENYIKQNRPEEMPFDEALEVYKKLGAEFVMDMRAWPDPEPGQDYSVFFRNRDWTIIQIDS